MWRCLGLWLTLAAAPLSPPAASRDLLPLGHKSVRHELVLEWPAAAGWRFVASPVHGLHGHVVVAPGQPFRFSSKYGTRLFAAPADAQLPAARERVQPDDWPSSNLPVREIRSIGAGHPLARVITTLRVVRVDRGGIGLEVVGERRLDADGNELGTLDWLPLALVLGAGAGWLWALDRRRSRTRATAPTQ